MIHFVVTLDDKHSHLSTRNCMWECTEDSFFPVDGFCKRNNESSTSIKGEEIFALLNDSASGQELDSVEF